MLKTTIIIILIQLYWLSLIVIGYGLLIFANNRQKKPSSFASLSRNVLGSPLLVQFFLSFVISITAFSLISVVMYLFRLPAIIYTSVYVISALWAAFYLLSIYIRRKMYKKSVHLTLSFYQPAKILLLWAIGVIVLCAVIADYVIGLQFGGTIYSQNDVVVHLTRVITIIQEGFSFSDGFFKGLIESRYHMNVIYALYVPPSQLLSHFHVLVPDVWRWSLSFFRLMQWLAIFNLAYFVCKYWLKRSHDVFLWAFLAIICTTALNTGGFFIADYPNQIVKLWMIAYVIGMIMMEARRSYSLLILSSAILIALTHPTYAVMVTMFTFLYCALRLFFDYKETIKSKILVIYVASAAILMSTPLLTLMFPKHVDHNLPNTLSETGLGFDYSKFLPVSSIDGLQIPLLTIGILTTIYLIIYLRHNKAWQSIALALVLFLPIIIFNPLVLELLGKFFYRNIFYRFTTMNVLWMIMLPLAAFAFASIIKWVATRTIHRMKFRKMVIRGGYAFCILSIILISAFSYIPAYNSYKRSIEFGGSAEYERIHRVYDALSGVINNRATVVANQTDSYYLPMVLSAYVIAILPGHTTPTADIIDRVNCQSAILKDFKESDLRAVGANFVVLSYWENNSLTKIKLADSSPYLKKVVQTQDYIVYKYDAGNVKTNEKPTPSCINFRKVEVAM